MTRAPKRNARSFDTDHLYRLFPPVSHHPIFCRVLLHLLLFFQSSHLTVLLTSSQSHNAMTASQSNGKQQWEHPHAWQTAEGATEGAVVAVSWFLPCRAFIVGSLQETCRSLSAMNTCVLRFLYGLKNTGQSLLRKMTFGMIRKNCHFWSWIETGSLGHEAARPFILGICNGCRWRKSASSVDVQMDYDVYQLLSLWHCGEWISFISSAPFSHATYARDVITWRRHSPIVICVLANHVSEFSSLSCREGELDLWF